MAKSSNTSTPAALQVKTCKRLVRKVVGLEVKHVECGGQWLGDKGCPNTSHLMKMRTGFCLNGQCEGTKPRTQDGRPMPTCKWNEVCPCKCHDDLDLLFAMGKKERLTLDVSGYAAPHRDYWMPGDDVEPPNDGLSDPAPIDTPEPLESVPTVPVPPRIDRDFGPTNTGRAAKGQLEAWVRDACDVWLIDQPGFPCTPSWVAHEIARTQTIDPPSVGAIDAVWKRWTAMGFAVIEKKPTRFISYTEEGVRLGLDRMKEQHKRNKKAAEAARISGLRKA